MASRKKPAAKPGGTAEPRRSLRLQRLAEHSQVAQQTTTVANEKATAEKGRTPKADPKAAPKVLDSLKNIENRLEKVIDELKCGAEGNEALDDVMEKLASKLEQDVIPSEHSLDPLVLSQLMAEHREGDVWKSDLSSREGTKEAAIGEPAVASKPSCETQPDQEVIPRQAAEKQEVHNPNKECPAPVKPSAKEASEGEAKQCRAAASPAGARPPPNLAKEGFEPPTPEASQTKRRQTETTEQGKEVPKETRLHKSSTISKCPVEVKSGGGCTAQAVAVAAAPLAEPLHTQLPEKQTKSKMGAKHGPASLAMDKAKKAPVVKKRLAKASVNETEPAQESVVENKPELTSERKLGTPGVSADKTEGSASAPKTKGKKKKRSRAVPPVGSDEVVEAPETKNGTPNGTGESPGIPSVSGELTEAAPPPKKPKKRKQAMVQDQVVQDMQPSEAKQIVALAPSNEVAEPPLAETQPGIGIKESRGTPAAPSKATKSVIPPKKQPKKKKGTSGVPATQMQSVALKRKEQSKMNAEVPVALVSSAETSNAIVSRSEPVKQTDKGISALVFAEKMEDAPPPQSVQRKKAVLAAVLTEAKQDGLPKEDAERAAGKDLDGKAVAGDTGRAFAIEDGSVEETEGVHSKPVACKKATEGGPSPQEVKEREGAAVMPAKAMQSTAAKKKAGRPVEKQSAAPVIAAEKAGTPVVNSDPPEKAGDSLDTPAAETTGGLLLQEEHNEKKRGRVAATMVSDEVKTGTPMASEEGTQGAPSKKRQKKQMSAGEAITAAVIDPPLQHSLPEKSPNEKTEKQAAMLLPPDDTTAPSVSEKEPLQGMGDAYGKLPVQAQQNQSLGQKEEGENLDSPTTTRGVQLKIKGNANKKANAREIKQEGAVAVGESGEMVAAPAVENAPVKRTGESLNELASSVGNRKPSSPGKKGEGENLGSPMVPDAMMGVAEPKKKGREKKKNTTKKMKRKDAVEVVGVEMAAAPIAENESVKGTGQSLGELASSGGNQEASPRRKEEGETLGSPMVPNAMTGGVQLKKRGKKNKKTMSGKMKQKDAVVAVVFDEMAATPVTGNESVKGMGECLDKLASSGGNQKALPEQNEEGEHLGSPTMPNATTGGVQSKKKGKENERSMAGKKKQKDVISAVTSDKMDVAPTVENEPVKRMSESLDELNLPTVPDALMGDAQPEIKGKEEIENMAGKGKQKDVVVAVVSGAAAADPVAESKSVKRMGESLRELASSGRNQKLPPPAKKQKRGKRRRANVTPTQDSSPEKEPGKQRSASTSPVSVRTSGASECKREPPGAKGRDTMLSPNRSMEGSPKKKRKKKRGTDSVESVMADELMETAVLRDEPPMGQGVCSSAAFEGSTRPPQEREKKKRKSKNNGTSQQPEGMTEEVVRFGDESLQGAEESQATPVTSGGTLEAAPPQKKHKKKKKSCNTAIPAVTGGGGLEVPGTTTKAETAVRQDAVALLLPCETLVEPELKKGPQQPIESWGLGKAVGVFTMGRLEARVKARHEEERGSLGNAARTAAPNGGAQPASLRRKNRFLHSIVSKYLRRKIMGCHFPHRI